jgi:hypothetical protein
MKDFIYPFFIVIQIFFSPNNLFSQKPVAVLIVGRQESSTLSSIKQADNIANLLVKNHFKVYKFYDQKAEWKKIKKILPEARIVLYDGHGTHMGLDGEFGGIVISAFISGRRIVNDIKFKYKPLILFQSVCGGAGDSAGDDDDIGFKEAFNRSHDSFMPFYLAGASTYIANNYKGGIYKNLAQLFEGKTLENAFGDYDFWHDKNKVIKGFEDHGFFSHKVYSSKGGEKKRTTYKNGKKKVTSVFVPRDYDIAFIGDPDFSIKNLIANDFSKN